ncbi:hypothetical protein [Amycolatopsis sp. NPDC049868]|uniref:hypothetical protein n=1 Tax=Amycolatopsis sp. NPDC049868 TaxID=3363934 RepID=UPI0037A840AF
MRSVVRRLHLFEFEDLPWFPSWLRDLTTDFLQEALILRHKFYAPVTPVLATLIRRTGHRRIVDLCSGASGPWVHLKPDLQDEVGSVELVFTDKYPNRRALRAACERIGDGQTRVAAQPVDATAVPEAQDGIRTIFTAFHHFSPATARAVLSDAFARRAPLCVAESSERRWPSLLASLLAPVLVVAHVLRRPTPLRVLCTVVPVLPLVVTWDGVVSALRTYDTEELAAMTADLTAPDYHWRIDRIAPVGTAPPILVLVGEPVTPLRHGVIEAAASAVER